MTKHTRNSEFLITDISRTFLQLSEHVKLCTSRNAFVFHANGSNRNSAALDQCQLSMRRAAPAQIADAQRARKRVAESGRASTEKCSKGNLRLQFPEHHAAVLFSPIPLVSRNAAAANRTSSASTTNAPRPLISLHRRRVFHSGLRSGASWRSRSAKSTPN